MALNDDRYGTIAEYCGGQAAEDPCDPRGDRYPALLLAPHRL